MKLHGRAEMSLHFLKTKQEQKMNNKMKKFSFKDVSSRYYRGHGNDVLIIANTRVEKNNKSSFIFELSFSDRLLSLASWQSGELITFDYDNGDVFLQKDKCGRKLSRAGRGAKRTRLRFLIPKEYYGLFMEKVASEVEVEKGAVCFKLV